MRIPAIVFAFSAAACLTALSASGKDAPHRTVTVTGDFRDQRITAPVRKTDVGEEVLVPGGAWTDCADDCKQALKNATFDFWSNLESTER